MKKLNIEYWKKLLETVAFSYGKIGLYELVQKEHKHFHPSGNIKPSKEDVLLTKRLRKCGSLMGIELLDHVIIGGTSGEMFSFKEKNMLDGMNRTSEWER